MRLAWALPIFLALGGCAAESATRPAGVTATQRATNDYQQLLNGFWVGTWTQGHFADRSQYQGGYVTPTTPEIAPQANPWRYFQAGNAAYAEWKPSTPDNGDAGSRLAAQVRWLRATFPDSTWSTCGNGGTLTAVDDAAWTALGFLEYVDDAHDTTALPIVKSAIDCALARFAAPDGGLWYNDAHTEESSYAAPLVYAMLWYDQLASTTTYQAKAASLYRWAIAKLYRPADGGFWEGELNGVPVGSSTPYQIQEGWSVTYLAGNMFWSAVAGRLNAIAPNTSEVAQINATAAFILKYEVDSGHFMNDRDGATDAAGAFFYSRDAYPRLSATNQTAMYAMFNATATSIDPKGRNGFLGYSGDWQGAESPTTGGCYQSPTDGCNNLPVFANDVMWSIVAQKLQAPGS